MSHSEKRPFVYPLGKIAFVFILLAFSRIYFAETPVQPQGDAPATETIGPPEGMTIQEWNRTAVKDLTAGSGNAPVVKLTASEKRGIYSESQGVDSVQDDPNSLRVYSVLTLVNHATLIQVPTIVSKAWCGDLQGWTLEGEGNYVSVKPLAGALSTNLHVLTTDGRMFNFRLFSNTGGGYTDVFQVKGAPVYQVNAVKLQEEHEAALKKDLESTYEKKLKESLENAQAEWVRDFAAKTFFGYEVQQGRAFKVEGVFNDESFTYFRVRGDEKPTLFLETSKKELFHQWTRELVNFNVTGGDFYRVQKLLGPGQRFILKLRSEEVKITRKGA